MFETINWEEFEDTKTHKAKDRVTWIPQNPVVNSGAPEGLAVPAPLVEPVHTV
jgi:hypothetical protein